MSDQGKGSISNSKDGNGMLRREFCRAAAAGIGGLIAGDALGAIVGTGLKGGPLPPPVSMGNSIELCLNSRASEHSGLGGVATPQQLANVLWAAGKAPFVGSHCNVIAATPDGTFRYDPATHSLIYESGATSSNALRITYDKELYFDAGVSYMPAFVASVALWDGTSSQMASCPMGSGISLGFRSVQGLRDDLVAVSSDGSLPNPITDGNNTVEDVISRLQLRTRFRSPVDLSLAQLSQLLWAAYGCTPHTVNSGRQGLTVPSSWARYPMTGSIYAVTDKVWRYWNRQGTDLTTADHRIELVHDADVRAEVAQAMGGLPEAACYLLLCMDEVELADWYSLLEVGFAAGAVLVQATAMDLGCAFKAPLVTAEQTQLQQIANLPAVDFANAVVAIGQLPEDVEGDGDLDLDDHAELSECMDGPDAGVGPQCDPADVDGDGDVDLEDFVRFQDGMHP